MQHSIAKTLIMLLCNYYAGHALAEKGDELLVVETLINVRSEPSGDSEALLKLKKDRRVTEIQRHKNWIEVDLHRDDVKSGWIYKTLLVKAEKNVKQSEATPFELFVQRFNDQNEVIKKQNGIIYFTNARHKDAGDIELIATSDWLNSNIELRNSSLSEIFNLWSHYVPVGSSLSILVLDEQGDQYTLMMR